MEQTKTLFVKWINKDAIETRERAEGESWIIPSEDGTKDTYYIGLPKALYEQGRYFSIKSSIAVLHELSSDEKIKMYKHNACRFCKLCNDGECREATKINFCCRFKQIIEEMTREKKPLLTKGKICLVKEKDKDDSKSSHIVQTRKYEIDDFTLELRSVRKSLIAAARVSGVPGGVAQDTLEGLTLFMENLKLLKKKNPEAYKKIVEITTKEVK